VRHTEFWTRMESALGPAYARAWAEQFVIGELGERTVVEALDAGEAPKAVWAAVWRTLDLPASDR
jgi:Protein of unknown function (DUF3046)